MPRALRPATPEDDIAARRGWHGATTAGGVLTAEIVAFCQSGVSVTIAAVAPPRRPVAAQGLACRITDDGTVRLLLARSASEPLLKAVEADSSIAATMSRPRDHRSIQIKGHSARVVEIADGDGRTARLQSRTFADDLVEVGYPPGFAATYVAFEPENLVALEFVASAAFVQTPGPGAGAALIP